MLTEHLITFAPTAIGLRHMEQTKAGEVDMARYRNAFGLDVEHRPRPGAIGWKPDLGDFLR